MRGKRSVGLLFVLFGVSVAGCLDAPEEVEPEPTTGGPLRFAPGPSEADNETFTGSIDPATWAEALVTAGSVGYHRIDHLVPTGVPVRIEVEVTEGAPHVRAYVWAPDGRSYSQAEIDPDTRHFAYVISRAADDAVHLDVRQSALLGGEPPERYAVRVAVTYALEEVPAKVPVQVQIEDVAVPFNISAEMDRGRFVLYHPERGVLLRGKIVDAPFELPEWAKPGSYVLAVRGTPTATVSGGFTGPALPLATEDVVLPTRHPGSADGASWTDVIDEVPWRVGFLRSEPALFAIDLRITVALDGAAVYGRERTNTHTIGPGGKAWMPAIHMLPWDAGEYRFLIENEWGLTDYQTVYQRAVMES